MNEDSNLRVAELFAGIGGFHVGLSQAGGFQVVWANQYEPEADVQHAANVYRDQFPSTELSNTDIRLVPSSEIPQHDLLVAGFPCQDYSRCQKSRDGFKGLQGTKGNLWWEIDRIVGEKRPPYVLFENVETVLNSPGSAHKNRGRDFAAMLATMLDHGYVVEWRVISGADYGWCQRRPRIWILCALRETPVGQRIQAFHAQQDFLTSKSFFAQRFPCTPHEAKGQVQVVSIGAAHTELRTDFTQVWGNAGTMVDGHCRTQFVEPAYSGPMGTLGSVLEHAPVGNYYCKDEDLPKWTFLKGAKNKIEKTKKDGTKYTWSEGAVQFPDPLDRFARTITKSGTGRPSPDRSKMVFHDPANGKLRVLTPMECERLQGFPDNWSKAASEGWRYQLLGNSLITMIVQRIGQTLQDWIHLPAPMPVPPVTEAPKQEACEPAAAVVLPNVPRLQRGRLDAFF